MSDLRTLPHRKEAEAAVLGGILLNGRSALDEVRSIIRREDDFHVPGYQAVFRAMCVLDERGQPLDVVTLHAQLMRTGELEMVGGIEGLSRLDRHATAHNIKAHAELVVEAAQQREMVLIAQEVAELGRGEVEDPKALLDDAQQRLRQVADRTRRTGYRSTRDLMHGVFEGITERQRQTDPITGVPTSFYKLDEMTAGLQPGDLVLIAARPSLGKTAFALNIAANACIMPMRYAHASADQKPRRFPVLFFSLEMTSTQLVERLLCSEARVDYSQLRAGGRMTETEFKGLIGAAERVADAPFFIDDAAAPSIIDLRSEARRWRDDPTIFPPPKDPKEKQLGLVMVDYLQLARGGKARYDSREQEISEISRGLKAMAKELKVPVVALSQLNRAVDSRSDHRPQLSDLRESGALEQDADVIMFIYREERYLASDASEEKRSEVENTAEVIVGKQRNGAVGTVHLHFIKQHTRFENPAPTGWEG